jgi:prolipoprotein diacylglyceryltransferase
MIIGRIGCFSAGVYEETYGLPTSLPWGMDLGDHIPRHPVDLYEILFLICIWIILRRIQKTKELHSGELFKLFMIFYLIFRFLLDFIKPGWRFFFGLGSIQIACLLGLLYYGKYILGTKK